MPGLNRMLEAARRGEFQVLAVPDLDRFARTLVKGLVLEEQLKKYGVEVRYQRVPVDRSPEGQLLKTQLFAFAEYERHCREAIRTQSSGPVRYYACPRHAPSSAREMDKPPCPLPHVYAEGLEAEPWRILHATLLDPDNLAGGLAAGVARHDGADRWRRDRLAATDTELGKQRKRLDGLAGRLVDAGDGELYAALFKQAKEIETLIGRFAGERGDLAAVRSEGLIRNPVEAFGSPPRPSTLSRRSGRGGWG